jgi:D-serine deaminase-like pyridoxal phosphate-dependent protein
MHVSEIDTPALVVDLDILERNLSRAASYAREHGLRLRPHTKTHKSIRLARRQLESGAGGLTVAKVSEAEVMLGAEPENLLVAYPIVGRAKLERLMEVARRTGVTVALDSMFAARQLSEAAQAARVRVGVLAEWDAGLGRVGVPPGEPLLELARGILGLPNLSLEGIAFYPGHVKSWDAAGRAAFAGVGASLRGNRGPYRERRLDAYAVPLARDARADGDPSGNLRFQRRQHGAQRRMLLGGLRSYGFGHGGIHGAAGANDRRWRVEDFFLGPPCEFGGRDVRPRYRSARRAIP